jgi:hypothetical protein
MRLDPAAGPPLSCRHRWRRCQTSPLQASDAGSAPGLKPRADPAEHGRTDLDEQLSPSEATSTPIAPRSPLWRERGRSLRFCCGRELCSTPKHISDVRGKSPDQLPNAPNHSDVTSSPPAFSSLPGKAPGCFSTALSAARRPKAAERPGRRYAGCQGPESRWGCGGQDLGRSMGTSTRTDRLIRD